MIIVATTSLPAVDPPNADRWNAARSCQLSGLKLDALAHRLQCHTACKIKIGCQDAQKCPRGSGKGPILFLLGPPIYFRKISFLIKALLL